MLPVLTPPLGPGFRTSTVPSLQVPHGPLASQPPTQSTHQVGMRQVKAGRTHFTTSSSPQTSCLTCQDGVL